MTIAKFINEVGFKVREGDVKKVNGTISNIKNTAAKLLGAIGIGFSLTQINALVEEFGRVNEQVKNSTAALGDQAEIQKKIMESARQTRSSYAETAGVISDLVHESPDLFGNIDEAVKFNNAATMLFKSAGKTNEDIAGLMEAINKSFAKGYVDSETISQLLERSPEAVELLNKKLGTTSDKLEEMASSRTMTVADLKAAFVDNASIIEQKFGGVQYRITDALTVIRSEWGLWLTQMDSTLGVTNTIANAMVKFSDTAMRVMNRVRNAVQWLSDKLGGSEKLLKLLTILINYEAICCGAEGADEIVVRKFIESSAGMTPCIYNGLPLRPEFRVFYDFDARKPIFTANYWDYDYVYPHLYHATDKIIFEHERERLEGVYAHFKDAVQDKVADAMQNVQGLTGQWSVDVLMDEREKFWLIDMAIAQRSAYWEMRPEGYAE